MVTITGAGFHPMTASKHVISFQLASGATRPCEVLSGSATQLTCRLQGGVVRWGEGTGALEGRRGSRKIHEKP